MSRHSHAQDCDPVRDKVRAVVRFWLAVWMFWVALIAIVFLAVTGDLAALGRDIAGVFFGG